ncbi:hypothetical protein, partial [Xenorhabdus doucetiae]|uniref:hypothetical protein n=1 Tax=Xenorhabdus doucetiae TaxID=351671 RepID=UPI002B40E8D1
QDFSLFVFFLVFGCEVLGWGEAKRGASPLICIKYILQKKNTLIGRTSGSAGIIVNPSRAT